MNNALNTLYIGMKIRFSNRISNFLNNESGVSNIVAMVLMILVVVLLAAVFWETISEWFESTMNKIMSEAQKIEGNT